jgi:FMN phosphatase YigB (HAD superfamily)
VVGDSPVSEIVAGNRFGMATVQMLRQGVAVADNATYTVSRLEDLKALLYIAV